MNHATVPLADVRGLHDYWGQATFRTPRVLADMQTTILLDVLGLGLEQVSRELGQKRPDFDTFVAWTFATAGLPDADRVERYHAWLDNAPLPPATARQFEAIETAPDVLDADDLAHWDTHGYVVVRGAISKDEAEALESLLWQQSGATPDDPATWSVTRPNGIMVQYFQHPALDVPRRSPRVHKAFAQLWGTPDLWSTTDRMSFNPPQAHGFKFPGPHLHWDVSLAQPIPFGTQGILYLTDTAADQGAFRLVPGMHHGLAEWLDSVGDADPRQIDLSAHAVAVPAAAGDLIIWRQDLSHGASPNTSNRPRMAQYVNMYSPLLTAHPDWK